jgi:hypothetical protein
MTTGFGGGAGKPTVSVLKDNVASVSTANCKTNLTGAQVWVGDWAEITNQSAIQVIAFFNQDFTLYIDQSQNTTTAEITDQWEALANRGFSQAVASVAPYFRIRITNKSASVATGQMTSAATAIFNPLPRKLDAHGHFETAVEHIHGVMGPDVIVSPMGSLKTATATRLAGAGFIGGTLDSNFWTSISTAGGSTTQANGEITIKTNSTANGGELVNSVRVARYIAANPNYYRANLTLPAVTTASGGYVNTRRWGAFDLNNGFFFMAVQTNPATTPTLSLVCRKTASDANIINNGEFNGDYGPSLALDNNVHTYEIYWTNKSAYFFVDNVLLHTFTGLLATLVDTPSLRIGIQCVNSGSNNAENNLVARSSTINRLGAAETRPIYKYISGAIAATQLKIGPGTLHQVVINKAGTSVQLNDDDRTPISGTNTICAIDTNKTTGGVGPYPYNMDFYNGLVVTISGAGSDTTIIYE